MRILILDDKINRHKEFNKRLIGHIVKNVYTSKQAIEELYKNKWDYVFLDHDLGEEINVPSVIDTGWEVAKWLSDHPEKQPERIIIHSFNTEGAKNMKSLLPKAELIPGVWTSIQ
jgi:two-component SAPR family response regulator